jgi:hypothetical protein
MMIEMVFLSVFWLNAFPHKLGVSQTLSPRAIVTGLNVDYKKHCHIQFGQYVQTHEKHDNTMTPCTIGALVLRPTGNQQGGYYFYSLMSGQRLHRTHWTELPMPAKVRDRVHSLAHWARAHRGLTFTDSAGTNLNNLYPDNDDDNLDYDLDDNLDNDDDTSSSSSDNSSSAGLNDSDSDSDYNPDLPMPPPGELAGVDDAINSNDKQITGVQDPPDPAELRDNAVDTPDEDENPSETPGVGTAGVDDDLEAYVNNVNKLEATLDQEIAALDANNESDDDADNDDESDNNTKPDNQPPLSRLHRNRQPNYDHLHYAEKQLKVLYDK